MCAPRAKEVVAPTRHAMETGTSAAVATMQPAVVVGCTIGGASSGTSIGDVMSVERGTSVVNGSGGVVTHAHVAYERDDGSEHAASSDAGDADGDGAHARAWAQTCHVIAGC